MSKIFLMVSFSKSIEMKNHMSVLITIISACVVLSSIMFFTQLNHWFSMLIILIYISGIMVLFMFVVSLAPNEKQKLKKNNLSTMVMVTMTMSMSMKPLMSQESMKLSTLFKYSLMPISTITILIVMMAYFPPKMMKSLFKGMKTSK